MKRFIPLLLIASPAFADQLDDQFRGKCPGVFGTAKQCECVVSAATKALPDNRERLVYYLNSLRLNNWDQLQALPDKNGYVQRAAQANNALFAKPCDP